jgi:nitrile hydratase subunit beta
MDGIHDLGGKEGFGPIDVGKPDVLFHHPWEGRMWSIWCLVWSKEWTLDWWRHVRELIDPADYLTRRYFDQWMQTHAAALIDSGILTVEDLKSAHRLAPQPPAGPPMQRSDVVARVALFKDYSRQIEALPSFREGDRVRTRSTGAAGHVRLPAYARGPDRRDSCASRRSCPGGCQRTWREASRTSLLGSLRRERALARGIGTSRQGLSGPLGELS